MNGFDRAAAYVFQAKGHPRDIAKPIARPMFRGFAIRMDADPTPGHDPNDPTKVQARWMSTIYFRNAVDVVAEDMEISDLPMGFGIDGNSVCGGSIRRNHIHDFFDGSAALSWPSGSTNL